MSQQDVDSGVPTTPAASPDSIELQATSDANGAAEEGMQTPPVRERDLFGGSLAVSSPGFVRVGKKTGVKIPETPEGITKEWLTQVYQNRGYLREGGHVSEVNIKPLGDGLGVAGDLARVSVELVGATPFAPRSFVAKFTPKVASIMTSLVLKFQFATEAHWCHSSLYSSPNPPLAPTLPLVLTTERWPLTLALALTRYNDMLEEQEGLSRPAAFYIGAKLRHKRFWRLKPTVCMLVEEMPRPLYSVAGGCEHLPHLEAVVDMLATLHARWWAAPKAAPVEWVASPAHDNLGIQLNALIFAAKKGTPAIRRCFGEVCRA